MYTPHPESSRPLDPLTRAARSALGTNYLSRLLRFVRKGLGENLTTVRLDEAAALVAEALSVEYAAVYESRPDDSGLVMRAGRGWPEGVIGYAVAEPGVASLPGYTVMSNASTVAEDLERDGRFQDGVLEALGCRSALCVPLHEQGPPSGALLVASADRRVFTADDVRFLEAAASVMTVMLNRVHSTTSLRASEAILGALLRVSPTAIVGLDLAGNITQWNMAAERLFGWEASEVLGRPLPSKADVEDDFLTKCAQIVGGEEYGADEYGAVNFRYHRKDGSPVNLVGAVMLVRDRGSAPLGVLAVVADVTALQQAEGAYLQFREILDSTTDFVMITDVPGQGMYINWAGRQMLRLPGDADVSGFTVADAYPERLRMWVLNEMLPKAVRDGGWSGEMVLQARDGAEIDVSQVVLAHLGADDTVKCYSIVARDITERKRIEAQLAQLANHDTLTNLYNRRRLEESLEQALLESRRYGTHGALMLLDLDQFKDVNDSLGHPAGDEMLRWMAAILRDRMRKSDVIGRLGGDEFAVLLPHTDPADALKVAHEVLESVRNSGLVIQGTPLSITASAGIALFPAHGSILEELLSRADIALYEAKGNGRNRVEVYRHGGSAERESQVRLRWNERVRTALDQDRFQFEMDPILALRTGAVAQYELLLRMVGDDGELILPAQFLDTAERFGQIQEIDRWVVRRAIRLIADARRLGRDPTYAINLSGRTLTDPDLLPFIREELSAAAVPPGRLLFEITETVAIANLAHAEAFVTGIKAIGCRCALDDFGVGFSSFYHLKYLPVDYLKIDGAFVKGLANTMVDQHIVRAIVALARALDKQTTAEFVGNAASLDLLRQYGVDYAQGVHIRLLTERPRTGTADAAVKGTAPQT